MVFITISCRFSSECGAYNKLIQFYSLASTLISNGIDPVTTVNKLGHANANTTKAIFVHQIAQARAEASGVRAGVFSVLREA